ncbi:CBS domain-containing protein, partial [Salmonella enterica]|nr:CBS domain-containing protein [Salmonella enterica]
MEISYFLLPKAEVAYIKSSASM